jgi:hypothetical protein
MYAMENSRLRLGAYIKRVIVVWWKHAWRMRSGGDGSKPSNDKNNIYKK